MSNYKQIKARQQQKYDIEANWKKAINFVPLAGELIIYSDLKKIKIGDGKTPVNDLEFFVSGGSEVFDEEIIEATPTTIANDIARAKQRAIIQLAPGQYECIKLIGKDSFAENLTIVGVEGVVVEGMSISSGVKSADIYDNWNGDISQAILPSGLTIKNITFTNCFSLRNARLNDLTIDSCIFEGCNIYINPECFGDSYGADLGQGAIAPIYRFPYTHVRQKNTVINNCVLNESNGVEYGNGMASGIHIVGVENVSVTNNIVNGPSNPYIEGEKYIYHGIKIGGEYTDYYVCSFGEIKVINNTINNTKSRAINVYNVYNGNITIAANTILKNANQDGSEEYIIVRLCENVTVEQAVNGRYSYQKPNNFDGNEITISKGGFSIVSSTVTTPSQYYQNLINYEDKIDAVIKEEDKYLGIEDKTEESLNAWLDNVLLAMPDNSLKTVSIYCGAIDKYLTMGMIYKHTKYYSVIELVQHVQGRHYTKIYSSGWRTTISHKDDLDQKADKSELNNKVDKIEMKTKTDVSPLTYDQRQDTTEENLELWLEEILSKDLENNTIKNISIRCGNIVPYISMGTIHKHNNSYVTLKIVSHVNGKVYTKIKNVHWAPIVCETEDLDTKLNSKADKTQINSLNAEINKKANASDLNLKMNEAVLGYDGTNDTDETGLENWLKNDVMPSMANGTIRNISVRVGGGAGDGKGIIPWPALGTIRKHTAAYATIDVTTQINGKHYFKIFNNTWGKTKCIEDDISKKADKAAVDAALANSGVTLAYDSENVYLYMSSMTINRPDIKFFIFVVDETGKSSRETMIAPNEDGYISKMYQFNGDTWVNYGVGVTRGTDGTTTITARDSAVLIRIYGYK